MAIGLFRSANDPTSRPAIRASCSKLDSHSARLHAHRVHRTRIDFLQLFHSRSYCKEGVRRITQFHRHIVMAGGGSSIGHCGRACVSRLPACSSAAIACGRCRQVPGVYALRALADKDRAPARLPRVWQAGVAHAQPCAVAQRREVVLGTTAQGCSRRALSKPPNGPSPRRVFAGAVAGAIGTGPVGSARPSAWLVGHRGASPYVCAESVRNVLELP
jgi:hypothetical protein